MLVELKVSASDLVLLAKCVASEGALLTQIDGVRRNHVDVVRLRELWTRIHNTLTPPRKGL